MGRLGFFDYITANLPYILQGLKTTLGVFFSVLALAFAMAIVFAILKVFGPKWVKALLKFYVWVFRGTPIVLQLFIVYYGFPNLGLVLDKWVVVITVFCLSAAAYETEIIRGGIISIDKGQFEACRALGLTFGQTLRRVVVPQAIRRVLPPTCSEVIILFKDTSLLAGVAIFDMMRRARDLVITDMRIEPFVVVLVLYLLFSSIMVLVFSRLEKRFAVNP